MVAVTKGSFSLNLGFVQLGGELPDDDRRLANRRQTQRYGMQRFLWRAL
jgi:hypothetical protein